LKLTIDNIIKRYFIFLDYNQ